MLQIIAYFLVKMYLLLYLKGCVVNLRYELKTHFKEVIVFVIIIFSHIEYISLFSAVYHVKLKSYFFKDILKTEYTKEMIVKIKTNLLKQLFHIIMNTGK